MAEEKEKTMFDYLEEADIRIVLSCKDWTLWVVEP